MLRDWLCCNRRRTSHCEDEFELVEEPIVVVVKSNEGVTTFRGVSVERQDTARRAGIEARAKLQGFKEKVKPTYETPSCRIKDRVWVVVRTKDSVVLGKIFDRWSTAAPLCLDRYTRVLADASILHGWPSKVEADIYLKEALRGSRR